MVEQDEACIEVLRRSKLWQPEFYYLGDQITFESINLTLTVEAIYERVDNEDVRLFRQPAQGDNQQS